MNRGGYQILDLLDKKLASGTGVTIPGSHNRIKYNNRKVILLCGCTVQASGNGAVTALNDEFVNFTETEGTYSATLSNGGTLTVTSADLVTYTEA